MLALAAAAFISMLLVRSHRIQCKKLFYFVLDMSQKCSLASSRLTLLTMSASTHSSSLGPPPSSLGAAAPVAAGRLVAVASPPLHDAIVTGLATMKIGFKTLSHFLYTQSRPLAAQLTKLAAA